VDDITLKPKAAAPPPVQAPISGAADDLPPSVFLYLSVALVAGAVIALQIGIMRIFSVGSWAHSAHWW
jgi:hypothetical protein